jgi:hypothetical protein
MPETKIEWVTNRDGSRGHTINPIRFRNLETGKIGHHCQKISPGCANCYATLRDLLSPKGEADD